ncbi:centromere protein M-like [Amphiura filiformis]|uniref:centromere protein M-like n=1 Tax=Amphiura filiformis TaxID=82378 RepID=UPI003B21540E
MCLNMTSTLTTSCTLPELNTVTILLVGTQGIGKHELATAMVDQNTPFSLQVRLATHLPLPPDNEKSRPRIDFVVFIMDVNNKLSISNVVSSCKALDISYFLGHACFVALIGSDEEMQAADMTSITSLSDAYDSPMLCGSLKDDRLKKCLAKKLLKLSETAAGYCNGVSSLLVQATKKSLDFVTEL